MATAKNIISRHLTGLLKRLYGKPEGQRLLFDSVPYMKEVSSKLFSDGVANHENPYQFDFTASGRDDVVDNENVIFVTGRFRSGSTLLWNIMRDIPDTTCYYEPFNERQWFNPDKRGGNIDNTHLGVEEYWQEYDGLDSLGIYFKESWSDEQLYMTASSYEPSMLQYIDEMIRFGKNRVILQFNRLDFRLSWIRKHYPRAKIIHIYRHPREQWLSYIKNASRCSSVDDFRSLGSQDFFYLRRWGRDLRYIFPFLEEERLGHLYELFYLLWRLSYNHGATYADYSLSLEDLSSNTETTLSEIFSLLGIDDKYVSQGLSKVKNIQGQTWQHYAEDVWFKQLEVRCEATLDDYYSCRNKTTN